MPATATLSPLCFAATFSILIPHKAITAGDSGQDGGTGGPPPAQDRSMQKACLERYRQASMEIMLLLRSLTPQVYSQSLQCASQEVGIRAADVSSLAAIAEASVA